MCFSSSSRSVFWSHDTCIRTFFISCIVCNLDLAGMQESRNTESTTNLQLIAASRQLKNRTGFGETSFGSVAVSGAWGDGSVTPLKPPQRGFQVVLRWALILILFNSLCLTHNSLQGLSDWRLSKQSWVHPSLELVFCGTSPSSLWALYQFDQICSITSRKHQKCFLALLCSLAGEICKPENINCFDGNRSPSCLKVRLGFIFLRIAF